MCHKYNRCPLFPTAHIHAESLSRNTSKSSNYVLSMCVCVCVLTFSRVITVCLPVQRGCSSWPRCSGSSCVPPPASVRPGSIFHLVKTSLKTQLSGGLRLIRPKPWLFPLSLAAQTQCNSFTYPLVF